MVEAKRNARIAAAAAQIREELASEIAEARARLDATSAERRQAQAQLFAMLNAEADEFAREHDLPSVAEVLATPYTPES